MYYRRLLVEGDGEGGYIYHVRQWENVGKLIS